MGLYLYQSTKDAFLKALGKLTENQKDLIFYIYSNVKIENFNSLEPDAMLKPYEPLIMSVEELLKETQYEDKAKLIEDIKDLIINKHFLEKIKGKNKGEKMTFLDSLIIKENIITVECSPILTHILATRQQLELNIDEEPVIPELIKIVTTGQMTLTSEEKIVLKEGEFAFIY